MRGIFTKHIWHRNLVVSWAGIFLLGFGGSKFCRAQAAGAQSAAPASVSSSPPAAGTAQAPQNSTGTSPDNGDIPKIRVGTNEVNVVFTVTDKHGKRVTD